MGIQRHHATIDERSVLFGGVGVPQPMEGNASVRCGGVTDGVTVAEDKLLHAVDSSIGGYAIRHQQLLTAFRFLQQSLQHHRNTVVLNGNDTHLAALAFYGEGAFTQRTLRRGGVHAEALMDAQTGVTSQIQGEDVVLPLLRHGAANQLAKLRICPCTILLPEADPYLSSGWNRPNVYSAMRFDEQHYDELFKNEDTKYLRNYISDESDYEKLIELYEQKDEDEPFFIFNVTMQNHGGYGAQFDNFDQQITLTDYPGKYPKAEQYLSLMHESDKAVQKLIEYFSNVDEPTVILFYGDHQGTIEDEFYDIIRGKSSSDLSAEEMQSKYITKFFIWSNYELDTSWLGENEDKHNLHTSVNYLSSILFKSAGIPTSAYQNFLFEMRKTFPIITAFGIRDKNGEYYAVGNKSDEIYTALRPYEMMIYNHVYDKKNVYLDFFCLRRKPASTKKIIQIN